MCGCSPPPHASTEKATWPPISAEVPIPDSAYDFTSAPGEVLDKQTCLIWKQYPFGYAEKAECIKLNRSMAISTCIGLGDGWRLPTNAELYSIVDHYKDKEHGHTFPPVNTTVFPETPDEGFWSSSKNDPDSKWYWYVYFGSGESLWAVEDDKLCVRCVR